MWQNLIIVIADEVSAMIDHAMKEIPAAALLYYYIYRVGKFPTCYLYR